MEKKVIEYQDKKYVRESSEIVFFPKVLYVSWFCNGKEILDVELAHELEEYYETIITELLSPVPAIL